MRLSLVLGFLVAVVGLTFAPHFPELFNVAAEDRLTASVVVALAGCAIGLSVPMSAASAVLQGLLRYDLANAVLAISTITTALASVVVLLLGGGLPGLVAVTVPVTLMEFLVTLRLIKHAAPELGFGLADARLGLLPQLIGFGSPITVLRVAGYLQAKTDEIVVGAFRRRDLPGPFEGPGAAGGEAQGDFCRLYPET